MTDEDLPLISETRADHERFDSDGLEQCPGCGTSLDTRWHSGPVYEPTGPTSAKEYDHLLETDPMDGPFWCPDCWREHYVEVQGQAHRTLSEFGTEDWVDYGR